MNKRHSYIESDSPIKNELLKLFAGDPPEAIFDIGSCEGEDSIKYSRLFPKARIIAFEPLPENQILINENLKKYSVKNVEVMPFALSDVKGSSDFHVSSGSPEGASNSEDWNFGNKSSSLLKPDKHLEVSPWVKFDEIIKASVNTLENVCAELNMPGVDFVHIDVQGAELKVLRGAGAVLKKIKVIWMEVADVPLYKDQPLKNEVEAFMEQNGFLLYINSMEGSTGDQMYINKREFRLKCFLLGLKKLFN